MRVCAVGLGGAGAGGTGAVVGGGVVAGVGVVTGVVDGVLASAVTDEVAASAQVRAMRILVFTP
jgi:hypothetical protein